MDTPSVSDITPDQQGKDNTSELLDELGVLMERSQGEFAFACGGFVTLPGQEEPGSQHGSGSTSSSETMASEKTSSRPITLRWDPDDSSTPASQCKLVFPLEPCTSENLARLTATMSPATFGFNGEDVYDETYRRALKLDPSQFSTDFCPYELGIIDIIAQILLPTTRVPDNNLTAVRAELYNLNIYAGPSGHFRAHVDTPRSNLQIGSLVVCLPATFEGGNLEVRHHGKTVVYDWTGSKGSQPAIQWAAFYSDCEHEVQKVQSGHRVTLTYNLYAMRGNGRLAECRTGIDYANLPLYKHVRALIVDESFMPSGGRLGFFTTHSYPHTSKSSFLPAALKGLDMAVWNVFFSLHCKVELRPVAHMDGRDFGQGYFDSLGDFFPFEPNAYINYMESLEDFNCVVECWSGQRGGYSDDLVWLNKSGHKEYQFSMSAYGNHSCTDTVYSSCAIIIKIPPYDERKSYVKDESD